MLCGPPQFVGYRHAMARCGGEPAVTSASAVDVALRNRQYRPVPNEAWEIVGERIRRFERGQLRLSQLADELVALRYALEPPRDSWSDTFDSALSGLQRALLHWEVGEQMRRIAYPDAAAFPLSEPDHEHVRDLVQTIARLVTHPDEA